MGFGSLNNAFRWAPRGAALGGRADPDIRWLRKPRPSPPSRARITTVAQARKWAAARGGVTEIECLVPDLAGVARGKIMPSAKFFDDTAMALPSSIFMQTISGGVPRGDRVVPL